jgi:hypothetical protein
LARTNQSRRPGASSNGSPTVENVVATLRTLWNEADGADDPESAKLKQDITQTINRLKNRVEGRLGKPVAPTAREKLLFLEPDEEQAPKTVNDAQSLRPRFAEPVLREYANHFAEHALLHLPQSANYHTVEDFRDYLSNKLRFNSQATRRRSANYIVRRFFPGEVYNADLPQFAATAGKPALGEALFYLTCRSERIVSLVAEEIVFPSLAQGGVSRSRVREYVQSKFPDSKSADSIGQSIVRSYEVYGIGSSNRTRLSVSLREGCLASFAYVLHLEFPEPGMHSFEKMCDGPMHRWLLWDQQWMIRQLYRLREVGLISKVSEIDRMRQFTIKFTMVDALQGIVALAKESPR